MEAKTYEVIVEMLTNALEMERWKMEQMEKKIELLEKENKEARRIIDILQKEVGNGKT